MAASSALSRPIRFFHRGEVVSVGFGDLPRNTLSVLDWLRTQAGCTGTKEGCNEGDCGACTVRVAELDCKGRAEDGSSGQPMLRWYTVNACLQFLPTLDGRALFTIEDIKGLCRSSLLHPVQQAMVDAHASQCGFCTPGFVMSLWHRYEAHVKGGPRPSRQDLADALSGNLCRCTGYRPILDAGEHMFDLPTVRLDEAPILRALQELQAHADVPVDTPGWIAPRSLDGLARMRLDHPEARWLAGSTDIGLWVNKQFRPLGDVLYAGHVAALRLVEQHHDGNRRWLRIGAGASLEDTWHALSSHWPELTELWLRFASPPVRHAGTVGGNVANGSPIGDFPPVLMALGALIELRRGHQVRRLPLEQFYLGYMRNALQPGEFVQAVVVPLDEVPEGTRRWVRGYKLSKRWDCDISALCLGAVIETHDGRVTDARLAFGGMAATVKRATEAEQALVDRRWDEAALRHAQAALTNDFAPMTDLRGSAAYRMRSAQRLLRRLWLETRPDTPLAPSQIRVREVFREESGHV